MGSRSDDLQEAEAIDRGPLKRLRQYFVDGRRRCLTGLALDRRQVDPDRAAVQMGSALGGMSHAEEQVGKLMMSGIRAVDPTVALHCS